MLWWFWKEGWLDEMKTRGRWNWSDLKGGFVDDGRKKDGKGSRKWRWRSLNSGRFGVKSDNGIQ
jgi:hypothetical protein